MKVMNGPLRAVASNETQREPMHPLPVELSFDEFFEAERARLFGALIIMTGNRSEAEELLQDAFLKVWERWERVAVMDEPVRSPSTCTALNLHRKRIRRAAVALREARRPLEVDELADVETRDEAVRLLGRLTPRERAAIVVTGYLGYSSEEAGRLLGIGAPTVRALATRARATLRATVEGSLMIDERDLVDRAITALVEDEPSFEGLLRRRATETPRPADRRRGSPMIVVAAVVGASIVGYERPSPKPVGLGPATPFRQDGEVLEHGPGGKLRAVDPKTDATRVLIDSPDRGCGLVAGRHQAGLHRPVRLEELPGPDPLHLPREPGCGDLGEERAPCNG